MHSSQTTLKKTFLLLLLIAVFMPWAAKAQTLVTSYNKVTASQSDWVGTYLLVSSGQEYSVAAKAQTTSSSYMLTTANVVIDEDDKIYARNGAALVKLIKNGDFYTIKVGSKYLYHGNTQQDASKLYLGENLYDQNVYKWSVSYSNGCTISSTFSGTSYYLTCYQGSNGYYFKLVNTSSTVDLYVETQEYITCDAITALPWSENFDDYTAEVNSYSAPSSYPNDPLPNCWRWLNRSTSSSSYPMAFLTSNSDYAVSENCLFFRSSKNTPLYAILPEFESEIANLQLTFTYRNEGTTTNNGILYAGYMTDPTDANSFTSVLTCEKTTTKTTKEVSFQNAPAGSYIAFKYQGGSSNDYYLSLDNVMVRANGYTISLTANTGGTITGAGTYAAGSNITVTATASEGYTFTNWTESGIVVSTDASYNFTVEADRSLVANFLRYKTFISAGDWNNPNKWEPTGTPTTDDDVAIAAAVIIPNATDSGEPYLAKARNISIITGGSITIKDGGQLWHSNSGVTMTTEKVIMGYGADNYETNNGYYLFSSPVSLPTASGIANYNGGNANHHNFFRFVSNNVEDGQLLEWVSVGSNTAINRTDGFLYANEDGVTLRVIGEVQPSNEGETKTLTYNDGYRFGGWNLVGNPFVCNVYVKRTDEDGSNPLYDYYILNTDGDEFVLVENRGFVPPMSGLMIVTDKANQKVVYSREPFASKGGLLNMFATKATERGTAPLDCARVRFGEGERLEKLQFNPNHTKVYIPLDGIDYAVVYADGAGTLPLNFKAEDNGHYTLSFTNEEVTFNYLHLIDNMNGNDVDLLETPYYAFDAKCTDYASRFTLVFATGSSTDSDTFAFFNNGNWIINNDGEATFQVVDLTGRILSSEAISGSCSKTINAAPGIYMLRLINGDNIKVQKIVVNK